MNAVLWAWLQGIVLGLGIAAPFGPINIEIIRRHLSHGLAAGLLLGLGACTVDTGYIVLISVGLITAAPGPAVQTVLMLAGACILIGLAAMIVRSAAASARLAARAQGVVPPATAVWRHYLVGLAMTAASPMNLIFWFGVIASGAYRLETSWGPWPRVAGVMCGTVAWVTGLNLALVSGRRWIRPGPLTAINLASAAILVGMAAWGLWRTLG